MLDVDTKVEDQLSEGGPRRVLVATVQLRKPLRDFHWVMPRQRRGPVSATGSHRYVALGDSGLLRCRRIPLTFRRQSSIIRENVFNQCSSGTTTGGLCNMP